MPLDTLDDILAAITSRHAPVLSLLARYHTTEYQRLWREHVQLYRVFAKRLLAQGNPGPALELIREGLATERHPGDANLLYFEALALSRSGNVRRTEALLDTLLSRSDLSLELQVEALSLRGRAWKDRYLLARNRVEQARLARSSAEQYERAFELSADSFPGSNAATMARLAGDLDRSRRLAERSRDSALLKAKKPGNDADYWMLASLGEAHLLLGELPDARECYRRAVSLAGKDHGSIARMRQQLLMLAPVESAVDSLLGLFRLGAVLAFAGHRIDPPEDVAAGLVRFPSSPALEALVRAAIRAELQRLDPIAGYVAPSCGADLLFAELMLERGNELHVVLPFHEDDFFRMRVDYGLDSMRDWRKRYQRVLEREQVTAHFAIQEEFLDDYALFDFANEFMQGLALARARQVGTEAQGLVVLDSEAGADSGTALFQQNWEQASRSRAHVIDLAPLRTQAGVPAAAAVSVPAAERVRKRELRAMLFADVKNFSKLPEHKAPDFFLAFLNRVHDAIRRCAVKPLFSNTWGDGLYVVLPDVRSAADFALRLLAELETMDWEALGLPRDTGVRVGLHTGPVFKGIDPIIERENFFGSHVSRAARIEPVTVPGCAFTSEQFAACLTVEAPDEFVCEYLGDHDLAKDYDRCPLYRLMRREAAPV